MNRLLFSLVAITSCCAAPGIAFADTVTAASSLSGTIQPTGPRTGTNGTNFFNVEGSNNGTFASFGVLDFTVSSFNLAFPATDVSTLTLALTESNSGFTTASGGLAFYLVTDTTTSIANDGTSPLIYQSANAPEGLGTQLGTAYSLGTGTFSSTPVTGFVDNYSLNLDGAAKTYFLSQLNTSNATLRLVVAPTDATGASTWAGSTNSSAATRPMLTFNATLDQPSLIWVGGSGTWNATGGTSWSGGAWDSSRTALFNTGSGTVTLGTPVTATGITFNTTGYTIAGSGANVLTLAPGTGGNVISVANAPDSATISATIAGSSGLNKTGAGILTLTGINTFTGAVTISGGALAVTTDSNLGNATNGVALNGGTFKSTTALTVGSARTLSGAGTVDSTGGAIAFNGPVDISGLTVTGANSVTFSGASAAIVGATLNAGSSLIISAPLTGTARTTFTGDGTVQLNGNNANFTGGVQMSRGTGAVGPTVVLGSSTALGSTQLFLNAGVLRAPSNLTGANAISTPVSYGGSVTFAGSDMEFTGGFTFFGSASKTLTINNNTTIATDMGTAAFSKLIKAGSGKLTLLAFNSYEGGTDVLAGTLQVAAGGALGTGNVTVSSGATLRLDAEFSIDDTSNLLLSSDGLSFATLDLDFNGSLFETVNTLTIDGIPQAPGTYNASNLPDYIVGTGNLVVTTIPEPQIMLLLFVSGGLLMASGSIRNHFRRAKKL